MRKPDANGPLVRLELLDARERHDGAADVAEALGGEVGARDVLYEGAEVDARVLLGVAVGCWFLLAFCTVWKLVEKRDAG